MGHPNWHLLLWVQREQQEGKEKKEGKKKKKEEKSMQSFMLRRSCLILCPGAAASGWGNCCAGFSSRWHFPQTWLLFQARAR